MRLLALLLLAALAAAPSHAQNHLGHGTALADEADFYGFGHAAVRYQDQLLVGAAESGVVIAYRRDAGAWTEFQRFGPDGPDAGFAGFSLTVVGDILFVGAPNTTGPGGELFAGAVHLYALNAASGEWEPLQVISAAVPDEAAYFGTSLAGNTDTLFVGAPHRAAIDPSGGAIAHLTGPLGGRVFVYRRDAGSGEWQMADTLQGEFDTAGAGFGSALAADDDWAVVGEQGGPSGVVSLYSLVGGAVTLVHRAKDPTGEAPATFGRSLSLFDDRLLVGAAEAAADGPPPGRAFVFSVDADGLDHLATLRDDAAMFGWSVAFVNGSRALVGAPADGGFLLHFAQDDAGDWTLTQRLAEPVDSRMRPLQFSETLAFTGGELYVGAPSATARSNIPLPPTSSGVLYEIPFIEPPLADLSLSVSAPDVAPPDSTWAMEFTVIGDPVEDVDLAFVTVRTTLPIEPLPNGCFALREEITRCELGAIGAGTTAEFALTLRTPPQGASPVFFDAYVGAEKADPDTTDNRHHGQALLDEARPVDTPASGGGSLGWLWALFLLGMLEFRFGPRRSSRCSAPISASPVSTPNSPRR